MALASDSESEGAEKVAGNANINVNGDDIDVFRTCNDNGALFDSSGCSFGSLNENRLPRNRHQSKGKGIRGPWRPRSGEEQIRHAEAQKKYREKKKQLKENLESRMKAYSEECSALKVQNQHLQTQANATESLIQYATLMTSPLRSWTSLVMGGYQYIVAKASHALRVFKILSKALQRRVLKAIQSSMDASTLGDSVRRLVLDPSVFEDVRSFLLIDAANLIVEWSNKPSKRASIEAELKEYQTMAIEFHRPVPKTFFSIPPTLRSRLVAQIEEKCGEAFANADFIRAIQLTHEQYEAMRDAWYVYAGRYAQVRSRLTSILSTFSPSAGCIVEKYPKNMSSHIQAWAQNHLGTCEHAALLQEVVQDEMAARFDLVVQTVAILRPLQSLYIRLSALYSCDIRVPYGIILGLDSEKCEPLSDVGRPSASELRALSALLKHS